MGITVSNLSMAVLSLLCFTIGIVTLDPSVDTSQLPQCNDPGVSNCQAVLVNQAVLDGLTVSGTVDLLPSSPIGLLRLKAPPMRQRSGSGRSSRSYSFTEGRWGDATITFGNSGSIYGRISPESGSVIYTFMSCGNGCNVIREQEQSFFNNMRD